MLLLEFDSSVASFEEQPLTVPLPGVARGYTPDFIVNYKTNNEEQKRSQLVEVKSSEDLRRNAEKYSKKFERAAQFASARGWDFQIVTEKDIRTPRLGNLKFLREYRNICPPPDQCFQITEILSKCHTQISLKALLDRLGADENERLNVLPAVWHMVVSGKISVDLDFPLSNDTLLFVNEA